MAAHDEYVHAEQTLRVANGGHEPHYAWVIQYVKDPVFRAEIDKLAEQKRSDAQKASKP